jgi:hypothetical protein
MRILSYKALHKYLVFIIFCFYLISFFIPSVEFAIGDENPIHYAKIGFLAFLAPFYCLFVLGSKKDLVLISSILSLGNIFMISSIVLQFLQRKNKVVLGGLLFQSSLLVIYIILNSTSSEPLILHIGFYLWMVSQILVSILLIQKYIEK